MNGIKWGQIRVKMGQLENKEILKNIITGWTNQKGSTTWRSSVKHLKNAVASAELSPEAAFSRIFCSWEWIWVLPWFFQMISTPLSTICVGLVCLSVTCQVRRKRGIHAGEFQNISSTTFSGVSCEATSLAARLTKVSQVASYPKYIDKLWEDMKGNPVPGEPHKVLPLVSIDVLGISHLEDCKLGLFQHFAVQEVWRWCNWYTYNMQLPAN